MEMKDKNAVYAKKALAASCLMLCMWVGLWWNCITLYGDPIIAEWGILRTQFMLVTTIMALTNAVMQMFFYGRIQAAIGTRKYIMYLRGGIDGIFQGAADILSGRLFIWDHGRRDYQ